MKRKLDEEVLVLNVGGNKKLTTCRGTLVNSNKDFPDSVLATMFSTTGIEMIRRDTKKRYFIDYDGETFRHILNVIRDPSLIEEIPPKMSYSAWWRALGYWGLVDRENNPGTIEVEDKPFEDKSLVELGDTIKKEIMGNELVVVKKILEKSGYYKSLGKDRSRLINIPMGDHPLPWGCDLGEYVETHQKSVHKLFQQMMGEYCTIKVYKSTAKIANTYLFDGKEYKTNEAHISISLEFSFPSSPSPTSIKG